MLGKKSEGWPHENEYCLLLVVGKCLEKSLKGDHIKISITYFQVQNWMSEIVRPQKVDQNIDPSFHQESQSFNFIHTQNLVYL